jgi:hypothetical protein
VHWVEVLMNEIRVDGMIDMVPDQRPIRIRQIVRALKE